MPQVSYRLSKCLAALQTLCSLPFHQINIAFMFSTNRDKEEEETRIIPVPN